MPESENGTVINLWTGPRNLSTALMYSFAQRSDVFAYDEPLYAYYLIRTGEIHYYRDEVLKIQENNGDKVIFNIFHNKEKRYIFCKNMINYLPGVDRNFLFQSKNIIYIRDPKKSIISFAKLIPHFELEHIGIKDQLELFYYLKAKGCEPVVLDSSEILKDPRKALQALCDRIDIPFDEAMLTWPAGPKPIDGVWADIFYKNSHKSTGFSNEITKEGTLPEKYKMLYEKCKPYYDELKQFSIRV